MITRTQLLEIIANGENSGVEFKRDTLQNHDLAKELVAFSNLEGGIMLLGVEDDGSLTGLVREGLEEWVMNTCRDKIRPAIIPYFEIIEEVEPSKNVAVVRVPRGLYAYSRWHNNKTVCYIRVGSQSREPTLEVMSRLFQQRHMLRVDSRPISGTTIKDLDRRRLKDYFGRILQQDFPDDDAGWITLLSNMEIMDEDVVTVGGLLLFGTTPNRYLPQAGINAVAFAGTEKEYAARERKQLRGAMTLLMDGNGNLLETGLVEQSVDFVRRNTSVSAVLEYGARGVERPTYPEDAVREAIVNALTHRDYLLSGTDIELAVYSDRLEIISPGNLPNGITPESMRDGARSSRNPLLKDFMRDYGYIENLGMGVSRKIIKGMKEHNGSNPDLIEKHERFMVRLHSSGISGTPEREVSAARQQLETWHEETEKRFLDLLSEAQDSIWPSLKDNRYQLSYLISSDEKKPSPRPFLQVLEKVVDGVRATVWKGWSMFDPKFLREIEPVPRPRESDEEEYLLEGNFMSNDVKPHGAGLWFPELQRVAPDGRTSLIRAYREDRPDSVEKLSRSVGTWLSPETVIRETAELVTHAMLLAKEFKTASQVSFRCTWMGLGNREISDFNRSVYYSLRSVAKADKLTTEKTCAVEKLEDEWATVVSDLACPILRLFGFDHCGPDFVENMKSEFLF